MSPRARRTMASLAGAIAASSVVCTAPGASAASRSPAVTVDFSPEKSVAGLDKSTRAVLDALSDAEVADVGGLDESGAAKARPDGPTGSIPPGPAPKDWGQEGPVNPPASTGKLFYQVSGSDQWFVCSANVVAGLYGNQIATAGHCLVDPKSGKRHSRTLFIPGYVPDKPFRFGAWTVKTATLHRNYLQNHDLGVDYAFATVWEVDLDGDWRRKMGRPPRLDSVKVPGFTSRRIAKVAGYQGLTWNRRVPFEGFAFGYPTGPQANGDTPFAAGSVKWCFGRAKSMTDLGVQNSHMAIGCRMTGGASGGPLLHAYQSAKRAGYQNGVISGAWDIGRPVDGQVDYNSSPYFDGDTFRVYQKSAGRSRWVLK